MRQQSVGRLIGTTQATVTPRWPATSEPDAALLTGGVNINHRFRIQHKPF